MKSERAVVDQDGERKNRMAGGDSLALAAYC